MNKTLDIQKGHSYEEYRRYFAYEYDRGIVLAFSKSEKEYMDPSRQYWELKNKKGITKYYQLPKYVKAFTVFNPYCTRGVMHRVPARTALSILGGVAIASITCSFVGKTYFGRKDFDDVPVKVVDLKTAAIDYVQKYKGKDVSNLPVYQVASYAMGQSLYDVTYKEEGTQRIYTANEKEKMMTIGHGHSDTYVIITHVLVDISNCFIQNGNKALEESISYGTMSLTQFGKRDYYNDLGNKEVSAYQGEAKSKDQCNWSDKTIKVYPTKDDYMAVAGKDPSQPFLYNISEETVLTDKVYDEDPTTMEKHFGNSKITANKDNKGEITGYTIDMDLHNIKGVTRYAKRMNYLSGKTPDYFKTVHLQFITDNELKIISSEVNEDYSVTLMPTTGWFKTKFYYGNDAINIPNKTESVDYSKYQF